MQPNAAKGTHAKSRNRGAASRAQPNLQPLESLSLLVPVEEDVIGAVRNEGLLAHIAGDRATVRRGRSSLGVQALNKGGFGQEFTTRRPLQRPYGLQYEAINRAGVGAGRRVGTCGGGLHLLSPH